MIELEIYSFRLLCSGKAANKRGQQVLNEAVQARLLQATSSQRQLQEVMVDFWYYYN
ncbi:MAG: DUF1800 family protein [Nostoc sp.]|uniref:DUF1800 family protein n=1 Tax=Nostoc sp. TaxID=1180 RepID=UPI002FFAC34A